MTYQFEMIKKMKTCETTIKSNDISTLLQEAASVLSPKLGSVGAGPKLSGARGEIEIGIEGGPQICIRVLS